MPERDHDPATGAWHLDKRVPIALIVALMAQFAGAAWMASAAFKDIEANRAGLTALQERVAPLERSRGAQAVQLGRIEEQITGLRSDMGRLLTIFERRDE